MATVLDFSKFSFTAEQIRDINELLYDEVMQAPEISLIHTIHPNIVFDKEIGFIGEGGLVGVAGQGCDPTAQDWKIGTRTVKWTPKSWEILIEDCWKDLESTCAVYALKQGVDVSDFSTTDYYAIVVQVLSVAIKKFIVRLAWFSDTDAKNVSANGVITNGVDTKYFSIIDGFWKQIIAQTTVNAAQRVAIAENTGATYAQQELSPTSVANYLKALKYKASMVLRSMTDAIVPCTQSVYDAWEQYNQGKEIESLYTKLIDGTETLKAYGMTLMPQPIWDEMIAKYENTGTKLNNPHRAVLTTKDNLNIGVDKESSFEDMRIWYNPDSRKVKTEMMGKADAKLYNPELLQVAI
jgi:hypothetical protein|nr:MAG TPA: major capsid protein [Bacteriophage sp.]